MNYVAFISYSHADAAIAKRLHRWLESYRIPRRVVGRETPIGAGRIASVVVDGEPNASDKPGPTAAKCLPPENEN